MKRRWIIRGFFIGLLTLLAGGWAFGSHSYLYLGGDCANYTIGFGTTSGVLIVDVGYHSYFLRSFTPLYYLSENDAVQIWPQKNTPQGLHRFHGFEAFHRIDSQVGYEHWMVTVPFWFLIALSAALLWLVWRKTQAKLKGRAFPVEADSANGGQT